MTELLVSHPCPIGEPLASGMGGRGSQDDRRSGNEIQGLALTVDSFLKPPLSLNPL